MFWKKAKSQIETVKTLDELYSDRALYSSQDMFSPPAERLEHVLRFELTQGCDWGNCTYCAGYKGIQFKQRSLEEYKAHVDKVFERIGRNTPLTLNLKRAFVGGGNALATENKTFIEALRYTKKSFRNLYLKRISFYGRTTTIAQKGKRFLQELNNKIGVPLLIYWGLESGSPEVLSYIHKGCSPKQMEDAIESINGSSIQSSVMIMTGLGGMRFYNQHVGESIKALSALKPRFLTFMGVNPCPLSAYSIQMKDEEGNRINRPLTDKEIVTQMIEILERLPEWDCKVGCFDRKVDEVGHNPFTFGSDYLGPLKDKIKFCKDFNKVIGK